MIFHITFMTDTILGTSYTEKNQGLQAENRRLRERLLQLYIQIDTLSAISENLGDVSVAKSPRRLVKKTQCYNFTQTDSLMLPGGALYSAALDPKGENVALASLNGSVTVLTSNLKQSQILTGHLFSCRDVSWGPAGLVSCGFDKTIRIWDIEKATSQVLKTCGLAHSVCDASGDTNTIFAAAGNQVYWVDKRRPTPIVIDAGTQATSVTSFNNLLLFGGYDGFINIVDRRALQNGPIAHVSLGGGPVSSLSRVLVTGRCVAISSNGSPQVLVIGDSVEQHELRVDAPGRFGCRADITDRSFVFDGEYATVCGGRMAVFCDGAVDSSPKPLEDVGGFQYGAVFMTNISQKVLSYSEDGVVSVWSLR